MCSHAGATRWGRVRAALGVYKTIKRQRASLRARAMHQLAQQLLDGQPPKDGEDGGVCSAFA